MNPFQTHNKMTRYKEEMMAREKMLDGLLRIPASRRITLTIHASDFDSNYLKDDGSPRRPQVLIENAILDACLHNPSNIELFSDDYEGIVTGFNGFVVIKNKVYKHRTYTEKAFETDLRVAQYHKFSNRLVRKIELVACELTTIDEPENLN